MVTQEQKIIARKVLDCAYEVHSYLGPGLLESTYQARICGFPVSLGFLFNFNAQHLKDGIKRVMIFHTLQKTLLFKLIQ
jgi:hypothetical protein